MDFILINLYMNLLTTIYLKHIFIRLLRVFGPPKSILRKYLISVIKEMPLLILKGRINRLIKQMNAGRGPCGYLLILARS